MNTRRLAGLPKVPATWKYRPHWAAIIDIGPIRNYINQDPLLLMATCQLDEAVLIEHLVIDADSFEEEVFFGLLYEEIVHIVEENEWAEVTDSIYGLQKFIEDYVRSLIKDYEIGFQFSNWVGECAFIIESLTGESTYA